MGVRLLSVVAVFGCAAVATPAMAKTKFSPEDGKWKREGIVFSNAGYNNPDVIALGGSRFRAYLMASGDVISCISTDGGKTFTDEGVRLQAAEHPAVVKLSDGRIRMYYASRTGEQGAIYSAISSDGLNFTPEEGIRLTPGPAPSPDTNAIIHMSVLALPSGGYRMYYDADASQSAMDIEWKGVVSAKSSDGLNWTKESGFRASSSGSFDGTVWSPFVYREKGLYKLFFSVQSADEGSASVKNSGVFMGVSKNGLSFKFLKRPILGMRSGTKELTFGPGGPEGLPQDVVIMNVKGGKRMLYWETNRGTSSAFLKT